MQSIEVYTGVIFSQKYESFVTSGNKRDHEKFKNFVKEILQQKKDDEKKRIENIVASGRRSVSWF